MTVAKKLARTEGFLCGIYAPTYCDDSIDEQNNVVGTKQTSGASGSVEELEIIAPGGAVIKGGGGEGVILQYCFGTAIQPEIELSFSRETFNRLDVAHVNVDHSYGEKIRSQRCCFQGSFQIPPFEPVGRWNVYLTVQNINNTPQGEKPEIAAGVIGGHFLGAPAAQVAGCVFMMLGDHVFDIF